MERGSPRLHEPQCDCDETGIHFPFLSPRKKRKCCSLLQPWATRTLPKEGAEAYELLVQVKVETREHQGNLQQITMDLGRTFPDEAYFEEEGHWALQRVLTAFAKYDPGVGYVQGINFVAAALLWHTAEAEAFWLLVHLMEERDLRDNYSPQLPGLAKHCQIIQLLLMERLPKLHLLFCQYRITSELFITDWCLTLFGCVLPAQEMGPVLQSFCEEGWCFFYQLVLAILRRLQAQLLRSGDISEVLSALHPPSKSQRQSPKFLAQLQRSNERLKWTSLLAEAKKLQLDQAYIKRLHFGFRSDTLRFGRLE